MTHTLEECEHTSTEYLDECQECGDLTACVCLGSIVDEWSIHKGDPLFTFQWWKGGDTGEGSALTYREAMDKIAHAVLCEREGK